MDKKTRRCSVCGREYTFCPRYQKDSNKPTWYYAFCSENCKEIYDVTSNFENGTISDAESKKKLSSLDLSRLSSFGMSYKSSVEKINAYVAPIRTRKSAKAKIGIEEKTDTESVAECDSEEEIVLTEYITEEVIKEEKVFEMSEVTTDSVE